jgi:hypothetical protein
MITAEIAENAEKSVLFFFPVRTLVDSSLSQCKLVGTKQGIPMAFMALLQPSFSLYSRRTLR